MTESSAEYSPPPQPWAPGAPWPDPMTPSGPTRWAEGTDRGRVESPDHTSPWGAPDEPASVPDPIPGTDVGYRVGWLTRARDAGQEVTG